MSDPSESAGGDASTATVVSVLPKDAIPSVDEPTFGDGATWTPATGESDDGRRLRRVSARRLYAFAWQDDHGPDAFYST